MRILSQENLYAFGIIDLPYEMCALSMGYAEDKSEFFIYVHFNGAKEQKIAKYSTEAKARKAMEMLREQYAKLCSLKTYMQGGMELFARSISQKEAESFSVEYLNMNIFSISG